MAYLDLHGLATFKAKLDEIFGTKITEPASDGTSGQALTTNGQGGRSWTTIQGVPGDLFIIRRYTKVLGAAGTKELCDLTSTNIGISTISGYTPAAVCRMGISPGTHMLKVVNLSAITGNGYVVQYLLNTEGATMDSLTLTMDILWVKNSAVTDYRT